MNTVGLNLATSRPLKGLANGKSRIGFVMYGWRVQVTGCRYHAGAKGSCPTDWPICTLEYVRGLHGKLDGINKIHTLA